MALRPGVILAMCTRVEDVPSGVVIPDGVEVGHCNGCQARVYVSPSTQGDVVQGRLQVACVQCVRLSTPKALAFTKAGAEELRRWGPLKRK